MKLIARTRQKDLRKSHIVANGIEVIDRILLEEMVMTYLTGTDEALVGWDLMEEHVDEAA